MDNFELEEMKDELLLQGTELDMRTLNYIEELEERLIKLQSKLDLVERKND
jgi:hypothetical protein